MHPQQQMQLVERSGSGTSLVCEVLHEGEYGGEGGEWHKMQPEPRGPGSGVWVSSEYNGGPLRA